MIADEARFHDEVMEIRGVPFEKILHLRLAVGLAGTQGVALTFIHKSALRHEIHRAQFVENNLYERLKPCINARAVGFLAWLTTLQTSSPTRI